MSVILHDAEAGEWIAVNNPATDHDLKKAVQWLGERKFVNVTFDPPLPDRRAD